MANVKARERTIAFFEVVLVEDGEQQRLDHLDWQTVLKALDGVEIEARRTKAVRDLIGQSHLGVGERSFILHRVKGDEEWLARANFQTGDIKQLETMADEGYLESSVIHVADFGNVIGMMQGSTSAPSHKAFEEWLNAFQPFGRRSLVVRPLMSQAEIAKLSKAGGVQRIELKIGQLDPQHGNGRLYSAVKDLRGMYGEADVTLTISVPRGQQFLGKRNQYKELAQDVAGLGDSVTDADRARVNLVYMDGDESGRKRIAELVEHHITAKRNVPVTNADGDVVRIHGAIEAIRSELELNRAELTTAVLDVGGES